jgi:hypothetical protein
VQFCFRAAGHLVQSFLCAQVVIGATEEQEATITCLPHLKWSIATHKFYPADFQDAVRALMLCHHRLACNATPSDNVTCETAPVAPTDAAVQLVDVGCDGEQPCCNAKATPLPPDPPTRSHLAFTISASASLHNLPPISADDKTAAIVIDCAAVNSAAESWESYALGSLPQPKVQRQEMLQPASRPDSVSRLFRSVQRNLLLAAIAQRTIMQSCIGPITRISVTCNKLSLCLCFCHNNILNAIKVVA